MGSLVLVGNGFDRMGGSNNRRSGFPKKVLCAGIDVDMEDQRLGQHGDRLKRPRLNISLEDDCVNKQGGYSGIFLSVGPIQRASRE